jgi:UDP-2,3-diacylglucosamine hydrolase
MTALFISDLHLSPERPAITRAFFDFLNSKAASASALYILGDLVEAWIGDDDPSDLSRHLIDHLRIYSDSGRKLYFQHGNRDFLIGKRFARETGATLLNDYHQIKDQGTSILLCHGDTLCTDDSDYQKFRRRVRNPVNKWLLRHLPLSKRQAIAERWRNKSMEANTNKASNIMDVNPEAVDQIMGQYDCDLLIHGHTHRPGTHDLGEKSRMVLGDWHAQGWYIELHQGKAELHSFTID